MITSLLLNARKINLHFFHILVICLCIASIGVSPAGAMRFQPDQETTINVNINLSYGAGWRIKDPDTEKLASANADYADNPTPNNTPASPDAFPDDTQDMHGSRAELLDAFIWADLPMGGRTLQLRLGDQVIQWGESLFIQGGIASAMTHADLTAATAPGAELKEILLPTGALSGRIGLTQEISLNPEHVRWELHRVWVVEAALKHESRHIYAKRVLHLDEDSWTNVLDEDKYYTRGNLWRTAVGYTIMDWTVPVLFFNSVAYYDLQRQDYGVGSIRNGAQSATQFTYVNADLFTPHSVRQLGRQ